MWFGLAWVPSLLFLILFAYLIAVVCIAVGWFVGSCVVLLLL